MAPSRDEQQEATQPPGKRPKAGRTKRRAAAADDTKRPPAPEASQNAVPPAAESLPSTKRTSWLGWRGLVGGGAVVAIAALLAAAYLGWITVMPRSDSGSEAPGPTALAEVEARLSDVETVLAQPTAEPAADENRARLDDLNGRIVALELVIEAVSDLAQRLGAIEELMATTAAGDDGAAARAARIDALELRIRELDARAGEIEVRAAAQVGQAPASVMGSPALLLAIGPLRSALRGSGPFDAELAALRAVSGGNAEVEAAIELLAPRAAEGAPTIAVLRARFASIADQAVRAAGPPGESSWFADWVVSPIARLVTVRSVGDMPGDTTEAIVARAEARLAADDLAAAVAELEHLDESPIEKLAGWLSDARARVSAERALAALESLALAALSAGDGGG
jgi:hypothetical protein